jgi:outer membrane lipoprotein-sorting protein
MKKKIQQLIMGLFLVSMSSSLIVAQEIVDPKAKVALDKLSTRYDGLESYKVDFTLDVVIPGQEAEKHEGFLIQKGNKFVFDMGTQAIYADGTAVWVHLKADNELQINDPDFGEDGSLLSPSEMMRIYETENFSYAIVNEENDLLEIEMKPSDDFSDYKKIRISVNTSKNQMKKMEIFSVDGTKIVMKVVNFVEDEIFGDNIFSFNQKKYPNIYIEDLRIE